MSAEPAVRPGADREPAEDEKPPITPFGQVLHLHRGGGLHNELSEDFAELVRDVKELRKKGTLTLKLTVAPADGDMVDVTVTDELTTKPPRPTPPPTSFYADEHGNVSRRDPRQPELPLREA